jgi:hypothetical protein
LRILAPQIEHQRCGCFICSVVPNSGNSGSSLSPLSAITFFFEAASLAQLKGLFFLKASRRASV